MTRAPMDDWLVPYRMSAEDEAGARRLIERRTSPAERQGVIDMVFGRPAAAPVETPVAPAPHARRTVIPEPLSAHERARVLRMHAAGVSNADIAHVLGVGRHQVGGVVGGAKRGLR